MFHMPMSSPIMTTTLGFFACAKRLLVGNAAISAIATASKDVNGDLTGFIDPNFGRYALSGIWDLSPIGPRGSSSCSSLVLDLVSGSSTSTRTKDEHDWDQSSASSPSRSISVEALDQLRQHPNDAQQKRFALRNPRLRY